MPSSSNDPFNLPLFQFSMDESGKVLPISLWPMLANLLDVCLGAVSGDVVAFWLMRALNFSFLAFFQWFVAFGIIFLVSKVMSECFGYTNDMLCQGGAESL